MKVKTQKVQKMCYKKTLFKYKKNCFGATWCKNKIIHQKNNKIDVTRNGKEFMCTLNLCARTKKRK